MIGKRVLNILLLFLVWNVSAQQKINVEAHLDAKEDFVFIRQEIVFHNTSDESLKEIFLFDWNNSFSSKTTPLAKRFAENFSSGFHFEKDDDRGRTDIHTIVSENNELTWDRPDAADIIRVVLPQDLLPNQEISLFLNYTIKIPDAKFTRFGVTKNKDYYLKHWLILPAVFDGKWKVLSNKNIDDPFILPSEFDVRFTIPEEYTLTSDLNLSNKTTSGTSVTFYLQGKKRSDLTLYIEKENTFQSFQSNRITFSTNLNNPRLSGPLRGIFIERILQFLEEKLGTYPFEKMVVSDQEYRRQPVYGLNLLPSFISPFPDGFEYDLEQLKSITKQYLQNSLILDPRKDYWLRDALQIYLMMLYVETYYPDTKLAGSLSEWWLLQWSHASTLDFNDQYEFLYMNMARNNLQQPLITERDSLLKFNLNIANAYFGALGFNYLAEYIGRESLESAIKNFFEENKLQLTNPSELEERVKSIALKESEWFFRDYAHLKKPIDFEIKQVKEKGDSLHLTLINRYGQKLPVSVFGLNGRNVVSKTWTQPFDSITTITIPSENVTRVALNYNGTVPEINKRNNFRRVKTFLNKPFQPRLLRDIEDPKYNQLFFIPVFEYNLYDGLSLGVDIHNKNLLPKNLEYSIHPFYGLRSKTMVGGGNIIYNHFPDEGKLFSVRYGFSGKYFSYNYDLFYKRFSPFMTLTFRPSDLRQNERQYISLRTVNVHRDRSENVEVRYPNYDVFNFQYVYSDQNLIDYWRTAVDYQISSRFSKLSFQLEYRKLFLNNRQLNLRFFGGVFLFNDTRRGDNFFSFALDRPSDYMFDYKYYGRSETEGLFSQQLIIAEGGFKSKLEPAFANSWMTTVNASTNIWRWVFLYGDAGLVHNRNHSTQAVFDSGIRLSLVADYFELYFPLYSSLGFEPSLPNYEQQIRFIITLSPETLFKLFTRRWY